MNKEQLDGVTSKIYQIAEQAKAAGVAHLSGEGEHYNGRELLIKGQKKINFASCSYLGLSLDERLIEGAVEGVRRFGTSFPTSRSFLTQGYLERLEDKLETLFGYSCVLASSTSLAHTAFLPIFIGKNDVFICDHQVHSSVQVAAEIIRAKGCTKDIIRHNDLHKLEEKIIAYSKTHRNVWFLADGIYSMYGDKALVQALQRLLQQYPNFYVYIDDAHGMSWMGQRGQGFVLSQIELHPRMVVSTSLGKAFGSIGGVLVCNNPELKQIVKSCGSAFIFSSPLPPSVIGTSIAAAEIHLSPEIQALQASLESRIELFRRTAQSLHLPLIGQAETPIFFIPSGNPSTCFKIVQRMLQKGYYQSSAVFPSVPFNNAGVRFTLTNWLQPEDIKQMLQCFSKERSRVLQSENLTESSIKKHFKGIDYHLNVH